MTSLDAVRARFAHNEGLPFANILTEASIRDVLNEQGVKYRDRVFSPVTTIWGFLSQVLSEDHSCRDAVSRIIAHRAANGNTVCSPNTASYCNARSRILTNVLSTLAMQTAEELQTSIADEWKWNGRSVFIVDGSSVSMPDTPENQRKYPQPPTQATGLGFPLARIAVLLSLATGACHDLAIAPYKGKGTGETNLFRRMYDTLKPGDVVLADALFDDYFIACELCKRGIDIVARAQYERTGSRTVLSRPDGDILVWQRPHKPRGMTGEQYRSYPSNEWHCRVSKVFVGGRLCVLQFGSQDGARFLHEFVAMSAAFDNTGFQPAGTVGDLALGDLREHAATIALHKIGGNQIVG